MLNRSLRILLGCWWQCCLCGPAGFALFGQGWRQHCEAVAFFFERGDRLAECEDGDAVHLHVERRLGRMMPGKGLRSRILNGACVSILDPYLQGAKAMMKTLAIRESTVREEEGKIG